MFTIPRKPQAYNTQAPNLSALSSLLNSIKGLQGNVSDLSQSAGDYTARGQVENGDVNLEDQDALTKLKGLSLSDQFLKEVHTDQGNKVTRDAKELAVKNQLQRDGVLQGYKKEMEGMQHSDRLGEIGARGANTMSQIGARNANSRSLAVLRDSLSTNRIKLQNKLRSKGKGNSGGRKVSAAIDAAGKPNLSPNDYSQILKQQQDVASKVKNNVRMKGLTMNETIQVGEELAQARFEADSKKLGVVAARSNYLHNPVKQAQKKREKWQNKIASKFR